MDTKAEDKELSTTMCRICLKDGLDLKFDIEDCAEMVSNVAQIEVSVIDQENIPNKVCNPCFQMLVVANDIRNRCLTSKHIIDKIWNCVETKHESESVFFEIDDDDEYMEDEGQDDMKMEEVYECDECLQVFVDEEQLNVHILSEHDTKTVTADMQIEYLEGEDEDEDSVLEVADVTPVLVSKPSKSTKRAAKTKVKKLRYGCCQCAKEASLKAEIKLHFNDEHLDKYSTAAATGHVCYLCNHSFESRSALLQHTNAHRKSKFPCDTCDAVLSSEFKLQRHYDEQHPGKHLFACDECGKVYEKQSTLNHHKYVQHDERSVFECPVCCKVFHRKLFWKEHVNAHYGIKPYKCQQCPASFPRKTNLVAHLRSHTGERPYRCQFCPKSYSHCTDLRRHSYIHSNDWPYLCATCGKGFAKKSSIESHIRQHGSEGNYFTPKESK